MKVPISSDSPFYVRFGQIKISFNSIKFKSTKIYIYIYIYISVVKMFVRLFFQHRRNEGIQNTVEYILHASCLKYYSSYYLRRIFSLHELKSMRNVISSPYSLPFPGQRSVKLKCSQTRYKGSGREKKKERKKGKEKRESGKLNEETEERCRVVNVPEATRFIFTFMRA